MFRKLRGALKEYDIDQTYLADKLNVCAMSISRKMTGRTPWTLPEMYAVLDLINVPCERLHEYFPRGGLTA